MHKITRCLFQKSRLRSNICHQHRHSHSTTAPSNEFPITWHKPSGVETDIRIYNSATRRQVPLILSNENYMSWYTCGPTVYDSMHLGHASSYVKLDIIQRLLRYQYNVNLVTAMNITDVDDKIIRRSMETGRDWQQIARSYESEFWEDMRRLNVMEPNVKIRVSEHVPQIVTFIERIVRKGLAYVAKDNSVYFDVQKYPRYGRLQHLKLDAATHGAPDSTPMDHKLSAADFALWKAQKSEDEPAWESPWGAGRPGWHIECSVLASLIFGSTLDVHAGGLDLRFPHHENEEAQCCAYHDKLQWVNYWMHTGQLRVKGQAEKMSKSLKNTISVSEMLRDYSADEFRMACVLTNYRSAVDYSDEMMETARNTLNKFRSFHSDVRAYLNGKKRSSATLNANLILQNLQYARTSVDDAIKDDFNTAYCMTVLLDQISSISRAINTGSQNRVEGMAPHGTMELLTASSLDTVAAVDNFVQQTLRSFGFVLDDASNVHRKSETQQLNLNGLLEDLLQSRRVIRDRALASRSQELFVICDELRNCLQQNGINVKDHSHGSTWTLADTRS